MEYGFIPMMHSIVTRPHIYSLIAHIASTIFVIFCIENIIMGPGDWSTPFGFSARKILFVLSMFFITSSYFINSKINRMDILLFLLGCCFFCIFGLVVPAIYNTDLAISWADFKPLTGFLFIPFIIALYKETKSWENQRKIVSLMLFFLALLHIFIWIMGSISKNLGMITLSTMQSIYEPTIDRAFTTINAINYTPNGYFRVQWGSSCFLILGIYFGFSQLQTRKSIKNGIYLLTMFLAICVTQSRGLAAALLIGVIHYSIFYYIIPLKKIDISSFLTALFIIIFTSLMILPFFSPEFLTYIGIARTGTASDSERYSQIMPLAQNWENHLFWGSGFGSNIDIVRSIQAPFSYEVSILALFMKIGIIGLLFSILLIATLLQSLFHGTIHPHQKKAFVTIFSMILVYIIASSTNPYFSNFFGTLVFYCFSLELMRLKYFSEPNISMWKSI